jgi:outer membrane receptor for monomeric catechols
VSKLPRLESLYSGTLSFGNGFLFRTTGDINQQLNDTSAFRINFTAHREDVVDRDEVKLWRMGVAPSVTLGLGTSTQLTLSYFLQNEDNTLDEVYHTCSASQLLSHATRSMAFPAATFYNPHPGLGTSRMTRSVSSIVDTTSFVFGIFASDTIKILPQLDIVGCLRWDLFDTESENRTTGQTLSRTDKMWSYRGGLVFHPVPTQSYYFAHGTSFDPSAEGLSLAVNNANTAPEANESFEIGGKLDMLDGRLSLQGVLFRIEKTNARTTDPNTGLMVLDGEQRVQGFEIGLTGRILPSWSLFAGYTYLDSEMRLFREGRLDDAIAELRRGLEVNPQHATGYSNLGFLYLRQGQLEQAVECLLHALEVDPQHQVAPDHLFDVLRALIDELVQIALTDGFLSTRPAGKFDEYNRHTRAREIGHLIVKIG